MAKVAVLLAASVIVRCAIAQFPHSGYQNKSGTVREDGTPMHGDYEAQRHWMEITLHTPIREWYTQTKDNDLLYWGLDYPPLTAYHSWICGWVINKIEPKAVRLKKSRGIETPSSKLLLRSSVLISDFLVYYTGAWALTRVAYKTQLISSTHGSILRISEQGLAALALTLMQPGLILIDHGHFQYNNVCLGLAGLAAACMVHGQGVTGGRIAAWDYGGSILFVCCLCFKQIALYWAPAFFFYLLGRCMLGSSWVQRIAAVAKLGVVVIVTFAICFSPWLYSSGAALQVLHRIFPIARGLYEDKVANFWCAASPVLRFKQWLSPSQLVWLSLGCTVCALIPAGVCCMLRPSSRALLWTLLNSSLAFFLFAYQVHEKSILFALLPSGFLAPLLPELGFQHMLLTHTALESMYPLLKRDGLEVAYACMLPLSWLLWGRLQESLGNGLKCLDWKRRSALVLSILVSSALHILEALVPPPQRYPDLHVMLRMMACAGALCCIYAHSVALQLQDCFRKSGSLKKD